MFVIHQYMFKQMTFNPLIMIHKCIILLFPWLMAEKVTFIIGFHFVENTIMLQYVGYSVADNYGVNAVGLYYYPCCKYTVGVRI